MKFEDIKLNAALFLILFCLNSCDNEGDTVVLTGTVKYVETNHLAKAVPIKLSIVELNKSIENAVLADEVSTDHEGIYKFSFNRSVLPKNAVYMLSIGVDSLIITNEVAHCFELPSANGYITTDNLIVREILIDYPTYLQITIDKLNHATNDRIRLQRSSCPLAVFESTIEKSDTILLETMHFHYSKKVNIAYTILKENEDHINYTINDVLLLRKDTTKLKIEF